MRKYQQKTILEYLHTLKEAHIEISNGSEPDSLLNLLADCQEFALVIGNYIDDIKGEGTHTVSLLEEYCEHLYSVSLNIIDSKLEHTQLEILDQHINKIENSVKDELKPNRIEVVFLSYKASMSDSLESIYLAAKADPNCDAYWIPIPYYEFEDRDTGKIRSMLIEGPEYYPDYIECTDWQKYDIEMSHPDIIFTFNPFDAKNRATSVHPSYYCERLRSLTDLLVYVPYFVSGADLEEHFCWLPGCIYAHKVIVQSKPIREIYVQAYSKIVGNRFGKPDDKFIALGSPKFDKVTKSRREDFDISDEWYNLVKEKKVVFYNTGIGGILQNDEQYLIKLRNVLDTFSNNDDLVLWWRPHPLAEATYGSMRPNLLYEYEKIVEEYKNQGWGIFDDTPDLHRAIAWCDIYYGDSSSVTLLFNALSKPVVIQDVDNTSTSIAVKLGNFTFDSSGRGWGFDLFRDGLFELDFFKNSAHYVAKSEIFPEAFDKKQKILDHRYVCIQSYIKDIICFPYYVNEIMVYNYETKITKYIPTSNEYKLIQKNGGLALYYEIKFENKIYCFGFNSRAIVVFDLVTQTVQYDTALYIEIGLFEDTQKYAKYPLYISECDEDGNIILLMKNCPYLINYNLPTQMITIVKTNDILADCNRAEFDGSFFWIITSNNDKLIKWDYIDNVIIEYQIPLTYEKVQDQGVVYSDITNCGEYLLLFPGLCDTFLMFSKESEQFENYIGMPVKKEQILFKYDKPKRDNSQIYAFSRHDNAIFSLNIESNDIDEYKFIIDETSKERYICDYLRQIVSNDDCVDSMGFIVYESSIGSVHNILPFVLSGDYDSSYQNNELANEDDNALQSFPKNKNTVGNDIYAYVRSSLHSLNQ